MGLSLPPLRAWHWPDLPHAHSCSSSFSTQVQSNSPTSPPPVSRRGEALLSQHSPEGWSNYHTLSTLGDDGKKPTDQGIFLPPLDGLFPQHCHVAHPGVSRVTSVFSHEAVTSSETHHTVFVSASFLFPSFFAALPIKQLIWSYSRPVLSNCTVAIRPIWLSKLKLINYNEIQFKVHCLSHRSHILRAQ